MTRPLTLADRYPQPGDLVTSAARIHPLTVIESYPLVRAWRAAELAGMLNADARWQYIRCADGTPTETVGEEAAR